MSNRTFPLPPPIPKKKQENLLYYPPFQIGKKKRNNLKRASSGLGGSSGCVRVVGSDVVWLGGVGVLSLCC